MAHLWLFDDTDEWAILPLVGDAYLLDAWPPARLADDDSRLHDTWRAVGGPRPPRAALIRVGLPDGPGWVLLAGAPRGAAVNGLPVLAGIKALGDRDEVRLTGRPAMFFSTERVAELRNFPGHAQRLSCPRCREPIDVETPVVQCPRCDVWHHQSSDRPCWTYTQHCATCGHPTALDAGFTWTPERC